MDFKIIEDSTLVDRIEHRVALTWSQRLLSWPWRPWIKTRSWITTVPSTQMLKVGDVVHMHPEAARELRAVAARQRLQAFNKTENDFYRRDFVSRAYERAQLPPRCGAKNKIVKMPDGREKIIPWYKVDPPHERGLAEGTTTRQQPFPEQPWRAADTGHEAIDSMLDATEVKIPVRFSERRNEDGFPAPDSGSSSYGGSD